MITSHMIRRRRLSAALLIYHVESRISSCVRGLMAGDVRRAFASALMGIFKDVFF